MRRALGSTLLSVVCFVGCQHKEESQQVKEPELVPAARTSPAAERAIGALAAARCNHEERCQHIGRDGPFLNRDACMNVMLTDGYEQLSGCRLGIDQTDVEECLDDIGDSECDRSLIRLERIDDCRAAEICINQ